MATNSPQPDRPLSDKAQRLARELAQQPTSKVFVSLAEEYAKLGMLDHAAQVLEEGIGHYPGYVIAMVALGAVYFEKQDRTAAKDVLEAAIQTSPENMKAHRVLAQIYAAEGNPEPARRSCTVVLMTNPMDELIKGILASLSNGKTAAAPLSDSQRTPSAEPATATVLEVPTASQQEESDAPVDTSTGHDTLAPVLINQVSILESRESSESSPTDAPSSTSRSRHHAQLRRLRSWLSQIHASRRAA